MVSRAFQAVVGCIVALGLGLSGCDRGAPVAHGPAGDEAALAGSPQPQGYPRSEVHLPDRVVPLTLVPVVPSAPQTSPGPSTLSSTDDSSAPLTLPAESDRAPTDSAPPTDPSTEADPPIAPPLVPASRRLPPLDVPAETPARPASETNLPERLADLVAPASTDPLLPPWGTTQPPAAQPTAVPDTALTPTANAPVDTALIAVQEHADELVRQGFSLADRGATYSSRALFIRALRVVSQALDVRGQTTAHSQSLAAGLLALTEADDFVPRGSRVEADLDIAAIATSHRTPVLHDAAPVPTPLVALQRYYTFAQEQLARAGGQVPASSLALHGLGKLSLYAVRSEISDERLQGPKAMAFFQSALLVDPRNHLAANELGVVLARFGQLPEARSVLQHAVVTFPMPEAWHNLAVVHDRLGEADLAQRARYEADLARRQSPAATRGPVAWVTPQQFVQTGTPQSLVSPAASGSSSSAVTATPAATAPAATPQLTPLPPTAATPTAPPRKASRNWWKR